MSEQYLSTGSKTCVHLKKFKFFLVIAGQKPNSGMRRATNGQVNQQAPLRIFKTQILEFTKWRLKRQLTQNFEKGLVGFKK